MHIQIKVYYLYNILANCLNMVNKFDDAIKTCEKAL